MFIRGLIAHLFLVLSNIYHLDIPEFIHQPPEGLSWLFPCLAIRNKAVLYWCGRFVCGICFQILWVNTKQCDCWIL